MVAIFGSVFLVLALIAGGVAVVTMRDNGDDKKTTSGDPKEGGTDEPDEPDDPQFTNWLEPKGTIKVGKNRYVAPCQAFTIDDLREIYGDIPDEIGLGISEDGLDVSVADNSRYPVPFDLSCDYGNGEWVTLYTEQETREKDLKEYGLGSALYSLGTDADESRMKLKRYQAAAKLSTDAGVTEFIQELVKTGRTYAKYRETYDSKGLDAYDFDTVVAPVGYNNFEFNFFQDNVGYRFVDQAGGDSEALAQLSDQDVLDRLTMAKDAIDRIREHISDPTLSQSPAPTVLGTSYQIGATPILEPCAVLTKEVFKKVIGLKANAPLRRTTLPTTPTPSQVNQDGSSFNSCLRKNAKAVGDFGSDDISIDLSIKYALSPQELEAYLKDTDWLPLSKKDTKLKTKADFAGEFGSSFAGSSSAVYAFYVGNYFMTVTIYSLQSEDQLGGNIDQPDSDRQLYVDLINALVPSLKSHLKEIEAAGG